MAAAGTGNQQSAVTVVQVPAAVALTAGNNQTTTTNSAFPTALQVTVTDAGSAVIPNQTVIFTVHSGGASGSFGGSSSTTVATNSSGVATASTLTANGTVGGLHRKLRRPAASATPFR